MRGCTPTPVHPREINSVGAQLNCYDIADDMAEHNINLLYHTFRGVYRAYSRGVQGCPIWGGQGCTPRRCMVIFTQRLQTIRTLVVLEEGVDRGVHPYAVY